MRRYALGAVAGGAAVAAGFAAIHLMEPSPATGPRVAQQVEEAENEYTAAMIADWERGAEKAVDLALLASPGVRGASRNREQRELVVGRGDTVMRLLLRADVPRNQAAAAIAAMRKVYDPRRIVPGQKLVVTYLAGDAGLEDRNISLRGIDLVTGPGKTVVVTRKASGYRARRVEAPTEIRLARVGGKISSSLYRAAEKADMPLPILLQLVRVFSWDVDFQREIRAGDSFDVAWKSLYTPEGLLVDHGDMVYASLTLRGKRLELYRFESRHGTDYFDRKGAGARKPLLRTPIDGARLSSRYGKRRHPILGYTRMHRGVDFAARPGTPIFAAGDGRVAYAGRKGTYGIYVRIRHNERYQTAYAHMRAIRRGIRRGARVNQGQVIGYVGSTGRSTGPHLHYEILIDGRQVNPMRVAMTPQLRLKGEELAAFHVYRGSLERQLARIGTSGIVKVSSR
ncbi:MAG: peptidoglycan DD-metalloendopeptidase family protein [Defluviicoccus sp.]|nr:peptidoglycan DD-metalloendopeptidase family protein [Defluviicoccus sp.]MDE0275772.1 peptidoglycan DD-metalloendopeptidase family protein [Defluviicoccus sp.]